MGRDNNLQDQVKYEHQKPRGTLQSMPIPEWKWERIAMDFVGLPTTLGMFDSIWVIIDRLDLSTAFHPQNDRQSEGTIQVLQHMIRACVIDFGGNWDLLLPLAEFAYNNSYKSSIDMASFEALYGRRCRSPIGWFYVFEVRPWSTDLLRETLEKVKVIQVKLLAAQNRQKEYAGRKVRDLKFGEGEEVAYELSLPPDLSGVHLVFHVSMLKRYHDRDVRKLWSKEIASVKVQWKNHPFEEATWETESDMRSKYPQLFAETGTFP
ncbi:uncharacterized protein LOC132620065 [Lycium barbarum]|uniref:uncharacterized protein LOC132620065 n=1 Tax=Lycium barbarum TaxID=112863 RepID=UPI00293F2484|nr:uncharacterized protein LOC132620065 [Lycium barbarum]